MAKFLVEPIHGQSVQQLEGLVRTLIFKPATSLVGYLLQEAANQLDAASQAKPGETYKGSVSIGVQCLFGSFTLQRDYYYHVGKGQGHYPADAGLGLEGSYTPALTRLVCLEGADETGYEKAEEHLLQTGGIGISARQIQRVVQRVGEPAQQWQEREAMTGRSDAPVMYVSADGTGVPMRREELAGRAGKQADGSAKTRQAYLGCVFTQHKRDEKGCPIRDNDSTTYVSSFEGIHDFGPCLRREALRRGMGDVPQVVVLIDGAVGLGCMATENFKDAVQIVDFFHAMEHATEVVEAILGKGHAESKKRQRHWAKRLLKNGVQGLIDQARKECHGKAQKAAVEEKLGYFINNVGRMKYGTFREKGYFIGSGVVEAGCKTVIGSRCKQSGMRWSEQGAQNILALRCIHASRRTEEFWRDRLDAHAALNDPLPLAA